jgi:polysaccharide pyruvyl transferase WcaK-like protein
VLVEIRPGPLSNAGGHLMLAAAVNALNGVADVAVEPWIGPYRERAQLGLYQKLRIRRLGAAADVPVRLVPAKVRSRYGVVGEAEIRALLDASGYAFGDRFPARRMRILGDTMRRFRAAGKGVVMLPQAFGPFTTDPVRDLARRALESADLIYARDARSKDHVHDLGIGRDHVAIAPDFTGSVKGIPPGDAGAWSQRVAIVPNVRMTTSTDAATAAAYVPAIARAMRHVRLRGLEPVIVLYESVDDVALARELGEAAGGARTVAGVDPLALKGILASCRLVIASRYHAAASALSSGVPSLVTGWSHKYVQLLRDYGVDELFVSPAELGADGLRRVDDLLDSPERERVRRIIEQGRAAVEASTAAMWTGVRQALTGAGESR